MLWEVIKIIYVKFSEEINVYNISLLALQIVEQERSVVLWLMFGHSFHQNILYHAFWWTKSQMNYFIFFEWFDWLITNIDMVTSFWKLPVSFWYDSNCLHVKWMVSPEQELTFLGVSQITRFLGRHLWRHVFSLRWWRSNTFLYFCRQINWIIS